jgi:tRNA/tmRNA/rRNA uracil-C5-methylase (TrmA/RlmC/RlmD family)
VIFVRHTLPGEQIVVEITEDNGGSFCRGDAVDILTPAADRVTPPCAHAHPGGCGGCDFQHVSLSGQRELKASVVREQLTRLAGIDWPVVVWPLADSGLGWRRRIRFAVAPNGQLGLRAHRSHKVIPIEVCPLGAPGVGDAAQLRSRWPGLAEVEVAVDGAAEVAVLSHRPWEARPASGASGRTTPPRRPARRGTKPQLTTKSIAGPERLTYHAAGRTFQVRASGFWQTHPAAADAFTAAVLDAAAPRPGEGALDLYAGAGLFAAALGEAVTESGAVIGFESDPRMVADAAANLADLGWVEVRAETVTAQSVAAAGSELSDVGVVVLDPPRSGAGRAVMTALIELRPRVVVYVACDPAALARDVRTVLDAGWRLADLSAFDAFPMTHHVECIATLLPGSN